MIGVRMDDSANFLDVPPDASIEFKLENPIFADIDQLSPGSYTMPFTLPGGDVSPTNSKELKNPDIIENIEAFTKQGAKVFYDGNLFKKGKIKAKTVNGDQITANFIFGLSTVSDEFKTKKLRDIVAENIVISSTSLVKKVYVKSNPEILNNPEVWPVGSMHAIIVNGKTYDQGNYTDVATAIDNNTDFPLVSAEVVAVGTSPGGFDAPYIVISALTDPNNPLTDLAVGPADGTNYLTDPERGVFLVNKFLMHAEIGGPELEDYYDEFWDFLEDYFTGAYPDDKLRFPVVFNQGRLYNGVTTLDGTQPLNLIRNSPTFSDTIFQPQNRNGIAPFVRMRYVLDQIADYFGFAWEGDFYELVDDEDMLIWNPNNLDQFKPYIGTEDFRFWKRSFNVKDLVPDVSVVDFLKAIKSRYNLATYLNESTGKVRMCMREPIAKSSDFDDLTKYCSELRPIDDLSVTGVRLSAQKDSDDKIAIEDTHTIGDAEKVYTSTMSALSTSSSIQGPPLSPASSVPFSDHVTGQLSGPAASQAAGDKFQLRVFYYRGLFDNGELEYPSASINATTFDEQFAGVNGIYVNFWKRWLAYETRRKSGNAEIALPFRTLKNFDWEVKRRFDRNNYMIKSMTFTMNANGRISPVKAELFTMR